MLETALTVGIGLTMLLFAVQVGALGFLQVTADAASFSAARAVAVGVPSASTVDVAGRATPGTHVSVILRVVLSQDLPVITLDGADIVADQNGSFRARLNTAPNHFALARFYVEAAAPGNRAPAIAKVTDLGLDPAQHTKADDSLTK